MGAYRTSITLSLLAILLASCANWGRQPPTGMTLDQALAQLSEDGGVLLEDSALHYFANGNTISDDRSSLIFHPGKHGSSFREKFRKPRSDLRGSWHVQGKFIVLNYWRNPDVETIRLYIVRMSGGEYTCLREGITIEISLCSSLEARGNQG